MLATQNPLEMEGTYPLPEAQLDRFFFKLHVPFPEPRRAARDPRPHHRRRHRRAHGRCSTARRILQMQKLVRQVPVARHVQDYAMRVVQATHPDGPDAPDIVKRFVRYGARRAARRRCCWPPRSRRSSTGASRRAIDDVRASALPALRHRVLLNFEGEAEGVKTDQVLDEILKTLPEGEDRQAGQGRRHDN